MAEEKTRHNNKECRGAGQALVSQRTAILLRRSLEDSGFTVKINDEGVGKIIKYSWPACPECLEWLRK